MSECLEKDKRVVAIQRGAALFRDYKRKFELRLAEPNETLTIEKSEKADTSRKKIPAANPRYESRYDDITAYEGKYYYSLFIDDDDLPDNINGDVKNVLGFASEEPLKRTKCIYQVRDKNGVLWWVYDIFVTEPEVVDNGGPAAVAPTPSETEKAKNNSSTTQFNKVTQITHNSSTELTRLKSRAKQAVGEYEGVLIHYHNNPDDLSRLFEDLEKSKDILKTAIENNDETKIKTIATLVTMAQKGFQEEKDKEKREEEFAEQQRQKRALHETAREQNEAKKRRMEEENDRKRKGREEENERKRQRQAEKNAINEQTKMEVAFNRKKDAILRAADNLQSEKGFYAWAIQNINTAKTIDVLQQVEKEINQIDGLVKRRKQLLGKKEKAVSSTPTNFAGWVTLYTTENAQLEKENKSLEKVKSEKGRVRLLLSAKNTAIERKFAVWARTEIDTAETEDQLLKIEEQIQIIRSLTVQRKTLMGKENYEPLNVDGIPETFAGWEELYKKSVKKLEKARDTLQLQQKYDKEGRSLLYSDVDGTMKGKVYKWDNFMVSADDPRYAVQNWFVWMLVIFSGKGTERRDHCVPLYTASVTRPGKVSNPKRLRISDVFLPKIVCFFVPDSFTIEFRGMYPLVVADKDSKGNARWRPMGWDNGELFLLRTEGKDYRDIYGYLESNEEKTKWHFQCGWNIFDENIVKCPENEEDIEKWSTTPVPDEGGTAGKLARHSGGYGDLADSIVNLRKLTLSGRRNFESDTDGAEGDDYLSA